jgi:hypothetical protein
VSKRIAILTQEHDEHVAKSSEAIAKADAQVRERASAALRFDALADALTPLEAFCEWMSYIQTDKGAAFFRQLKTAANEMSKAVAGEILGPTNYENIVNLHAAFDVVSPTGISFLVDRGANYAKSTETIARIKKSRERVHSFLEGAELFAKMLKEKDEKTRKHLDEELALWTAKRAELVQQALAAIPNCTVLLPEITREALAAVPGTDCVICMQRLNWPSDAVLMGRESCHLAVILKCCCQFIGESCARQLKKAASPKCPFCRAQPLNIDGSMNGVTL